MRNDILAVVLALVAVPLYAADWVDKLEQEKVEQSGVAITILFDDSGSMTEIVPGQSVPKIDAAKAAFQDWIRQVPDNYRLGLVALNAGELVKLDSNNKFAMQNAVQNINASGGTPLAYTLNKIDGAIGKRRKAVGPYERQIVVVFTDGQDNTQEGVEGVKRSLSKLKSEQVESVGIGFGGQGDYMNGVATKYYDANSKEELLTSLKKVDSEIGNTNDIRISPEVRKAMALVGVAPAPKPIVVAPEPVAEPVVVTQHHYYVNWKVIGIIAAIIIVSFVFRSSRSNKYR